MALYCYTKANKYSVAFPKLNARRNRLISGVLTGIGLVFLLVVFGSIAFYQVKSQYLFKKKQHFLNPLPASSVLGKSEHGVKGAAHTQYWFADAPKLPSRESKITHYNLSIPVLGISQAVVEIGGGDLDKSMIHYSGTVLPGEIGNAVVFCHSVLPQFFNPKNYKTICSTLPTLRKGEEIIVNFDGIEYHYQIVEMYEVGPDDFSYLNQDQDAEYLSMITCVPPGTYLRRLVVKSRLIY